MSASERDPEQLDPSRPSRGHPRTLIERQIREAMDEGTFDDLQHQGSRLPLEDDWAAGERAMAHRMLRNYGAAPPWIESDKAVRALLQDRDRLLERVPRMSERGLARARDELGRLVDAANQAIERVNVEAPTYRQHRRRLDLAVELDRFDRAARGETAGDA